MTISSTNNRNDYVGNDVTKIYPYTFKAFLATDLRIIITDLAGVETLLIKDTDYLAEGFVYGEADQITLVDNSQDWIFIGGFLKANYRLSMLRIRPLTQTTDIRNQGEFYPETHENQFDHLTMLDQQQQEKIDRCLKMPESIPLSEFDPKLPTTLLGADNRVIMTNNAGDAFELGPIASEISNAQGYAQSASNSADAAAASETAAAISESNAADSETAAAISETNAEDSYQDTLALIGTGVGGKETILNNSTTALAVTIDETLHHDMIFEYVLYRGSEYQYGRLLISDNAPFDISQLDLKGNAGVTFSIAEAAGIGTLSYISNNGIAGIIRYKYYRFEVGV